MTLDLHEVTAGHAIATIGPVVIRVIVRSRTETAHVDRIVAAIDRVLERSPIAGVWVVVHHGAPVIDGPVRRYTGRTMGRYGDRLCVAYSLLGLGFWASAASAATVTMAKLMGMRSPIETTIEAGAERLCMEMIGVDPNRLIAAHAELLERIEALNQVTGTQPR